MPTPEDILDEKQIAEIEARAKEVKELVGVGRFGNDMLALCQTVRALRAENEKWQRAAGHWKARHEVVESRLAQVEQDRNSWRRTSERLETERASPAAPPAVPAVNNLQRRLYEECITANWDPEHENTFAEEIAHLHEELSEAFKAWRRYKDCAVREVNGKLEGVPIEFADALIGMFYNAELHGFDLLAAVERKHQFNLSRNYVAEGRQLHEPSAASPAAPPEEVHPEGMAPLPEQER